MQGYRGTQASSPVSESESSSSWTGNQLLEELQALGAGTFEASASVFFAPLEPCCELAFRCLASAFVFLQVSLHGSSLIDGSQTASDGTVVGVPVRPPLAGCCSLPLLLLACAPGHQLPTHRSCQVSGVHFDVGRQFKKDLGSLDQRRVQLRQEEANRQPRDRVPSKAAGALLQQGIGSDQRY